MSDSKLIIGALSDGSVVAASTASPFFCTVGESVEAVAERAEQAASFYRNALYGMSPAAPRVTQIESVVPHKIDFWMADAEMSVA